jgi:chromosome segregation ATPase
MIIGTASALLAPDFSYSAANTDPEWPCIQRKVPQLSIAQVWNGTDLPASAKDWNKDAGIERLVSEIAARRNPIENAQKQIEEYALSLPRGQANEKLAQIFQGLFDTLNVEREQVISGISRYADKQRDLAANLRKEASEVDKLRRAPDIDQSEFARRNEQLKWETRIFEERVQSLTFVCEVPTIIEQRLYGLSKFISQLMKKG